MPVELTAVKALIPNENRAVGHAIGASIAQICGQYVQFNVFSVVLRVAALSGALVFAVHLAVLAGDVPGS
ncbi:hydantoinase/oxoprolinase family protein, partial [Enterococcus faecalis]